MRLINFLTEKPRHLLTMQFQYIHEVLRLLLQECKTNPKAFTNIFDNSDSLTGFNFCCHYNKFTHLSRSFQKLTGYQTDNILEKDSFISNILHPHDKAIFIDYLFSDTYRIENDESNNQLMVRELKCRARHTKGYWKYLIFFSLNYHDKSTGYIHKIGLIADEYSNPNYQTLSKNIDDFNWGDITSGKSAFCYKFMEVQISHRETEILELIGEGRIAKEIATELNISPSTVVTHRKNLISKLNVRNTAQLIKKASQLMLI
jgi:DNA-binding CsgD family transcriptional regulator